MVKGIQNFSSVNSTCSFLILKVSLRHYKIMWTIFDIDSRCQEIFVLFNIMKSSFTLNNLNSFWTSVDRRNICSGIHKREFFFRLLCYYQNVGKNWSCLVWAENLKEYRNKELVVHIKQFIKDIWVPWRCSFWKLLNTVYFL